MAIDPTITELKLDVAQWIKIKDCPVQRDTERHAHNAKNKHLKNFSPSQARVAAAMLNGDLIKLDGHTRAKLWQDMLLAKPDCVLVDVYKVSSMEDVINLYYTFDNQNAMETGSDRVYGAYRLNGFAPRSPLLLKCSLKTSLKILDYSGWGRTTEIDMVSKWIIPIRLIDSWNLAHNRFNAGVVAAMIATTHVQKDRAKEFWHKYSVDGGRKFEQGRDGVQELTEMIATYKAARKTSGSGNINEIASKAITCFEFYREGKYFKSPAKRTRLSEYLSGVKNEPD